MEISSSLTYKIEFARLPIRTRLLAGILFLATIFYSTFSFAQILGTGQLSTERRGHTATLLQNGKILIVGGENQNGILSQAEIFDPVSLTSTPAPAAVSPRTDHTTTLLPDGRVLISGGRDQVGALDSTEVYDSGLGLFSSGPSMKRARSGHTATTLSDGKILIVGGDASGSAEIYDAAAQNFSLVTGSMTTPRQFHSAALLKDGRVLIAGGVNGQNTVLNSAEVYDPSLQSF
ncbi:MAG TPA: kelch repeat-containing protein, partial [Candidatus Udaeobacter sp.]|nr:kelch repeat-containing protein [Candidatus Udaeobacter sp.]